MIDNKSGDFSRIKSTLDTCTSGACSDPAVDELMVDIKVQTFAKKVSAKRAQHTILSHRSGYDEGSNGTGT